MNVTLHFKLGFGVVRINFYYIEVLAPKLGSGKFINHDVWPHCSLQII